MKQKRLWIYEAREENFLPLTYTRAVFELVCGVKKLWERLREQLEAVDISLFTRDYLADVVRERTGVEVNEGVGQGEEVVIFDGGVLLEDAGAERVRETEAPVVFLLDGEVVGVKTVFERPLKVQGLGAVRDMVKRLAEDESVQKVEISGKLIKFLWQCVEENGKVLKKDFEDFGFAEGAGKFSESVQVLGQKDLLYIGKGCEIQPEVFIDTREGPVIIEDDVKIKAFSSIEGPAYIGAGTIVARAQIHGGTTIGPVCRIGGEVAESIFLGYSNKVHAGFIGHSIIGEWVNIGAMSTNSNLKDTYGPVRVNVGGQKIEAGLKVGCFVGDNAKFSIGTMVYTGKRIGVASHLHGFIFQDVPSFTIWAKSFGVEPYEFELDAVIRVHERMAKRRGVEQTEAYRKLLEYVYELTREEREKAGVLKGRFSF